MAYCPRVLVTVGSEARVKKDEHVPFRDDIRQWANFSAMLTAPWRMVWGWLLGCQVHGEDMMYTRRVSLPIMAYTCQRQSPSIMS